MSWNSVILVVCVFTSISVNCSRGENIQTEKIQQTISSNPAWLISRWPLSLCDFALQTLSRSKSQPKARQRYSSMQSVRRLPFKKFTRQFPSVCLGSGAGEPLADEATLLSAHHLMGGSFGFSPTHCWWRRNLKQQKNLLSAEDLKTVWNISVTSSFMYSPHHSHGAPAMELCLHWRLSSWTLYSQCVWALPRVIISSCKRPTHKQKLQERDIEEEWCIYVNMSEFLHVFIYGLRCIFRLTVMFSGVREGKCGNLGHFRPFSPLKMKL